MKTRFIHIVFSSLLLCNLIFAQVVIDFFHDHHAHATCENLLHGDDSTPILEKDSEKCQICSLNIAHELFYYDLTISENTFSYKKVFFSPKILQLENTCTYCSGRAPPVFLFTSNLSV